MKPRPNKAVMAFLDTNLIVLAFPTVTEIMRGIENIRLAQPEKALALTASLSVTFKTNAYLDRVTPEVAELLALMLACKELKNFWVDNPSGKWPVFREHLTIAALSICSGIPVATMNRTAYSRISAFFPLPGIYYPGDLRWHSPASNRSWLSAAAVGQHTNGMLA